MMEIVIKDILIITILMTKIKFNALKIIFAQITTKQLYKNKYIKNCINDYQYKFEYKNYYYEKCPEDTIEIDSINKLCGLKCQNFSKYYNYAQTECFLSIPEGYYCNNTTLKTIDKCHDNCKTCEEGPTNNNNKCLICKDINILIWEIVTIIVSMDILLIILHLF